MKERFFKPMPAFRNPTNGYTERPDSPILFSLLFGPLYLLSKGAWQSALAVAGGLWIAMAFFGFAGFGFVWVIAAFMAKDFVEKGYLRRGWHKVAPADDEAVSD